MNAKLEIVMFATDDIITTSGEGKYDESGKLIIDDGDPNSGLFS